MSHPLSFLLCKRAQPHCRHNAQRTKNKNIHKDDATMVVSGLKKSIREQDWEETSRILNDHPELAEKELSRAEFTILWKKAPLETIRALLEAWPDAHERKVRHLVFTFDLVEVKSDKKQWDFLDAIFVEFPQVLETTYARTAAIHGAPLDFLNKHWKEAGSLLYTIHKKDWGEACRILSDFPHLAKDEVSTFEFHILWGDAPLETIQALLKAWPEAYQGQGGYYGNLIDAKLNGKQWDFLDTIFLEFPQVLETTYARTAAIHGASNEFLNQHWKETGTLLYSVHNKDWEGTSRILLDYPRIAKDSFSEKEFDILWRDAPLETIQTLLAAWPEAHEQKDNHHRKNLIDVKIRRGQWEFLKSILPLCPNIVTAEDVLNAYRVGVPLDIIKLMLDQQPNAPLEYPDVIFKLIAWNELEHFCAVLDRCPAATDLKNEHLHLTPLLFVFQEKERIDVDWIGPILNANPNAAMEKDFDGKKSLHLAYQHGASSELIDMIQKAYPEAENERDNLGRFPKDLANQSEKKAFTPANETLVLVNKVAVNQSGDFNAEKKPFPGNAVVVCRGDMLIRDPQSGENEKDKKTYENYLKQIVARHRIFETLLDEFSKMVGVDNKDVIQKAAAIQALASQYLSNKNGTMIEFDMFDNPGYWYQQEVLKLVMRVYQETRSKLDDPRPSVLHDAEVSMKHLDDRANGTDSLNPSDEHVKAYNDLTEWLTKGLDSALYSLQGPVLKPLQSLFNKLFIRRGQTSVHVIGDMARATLLVDDMETLKKIVQRIKNTFPNITENQFRQPDKFDGLADFLSYIHDDLNFVPDSDCVLPYRFKANSSQKKKEETLWFNFNFFLQVPEYHRVGFSEMFVACELQIGLAEEINKHRSVHVAYERDRILSNQPLLKNYDAMAKEMNKQDSQPLKKEDDDEDRFSKLSNCTEDDNKLIEKVLFGKMASEVSIPCTTVGSNNGDNILLFENGPFSLSRNEIGAGSFVKPERLCLNNRSFNWFASDNCNSHEIAFHAAVPYKLDATKRYFVDSFLLKDSCVDGFYGTVGLYAHVGPFLIQIACGAVRKSTKDIVMIRSGQNFSYLEQVCPVPTDTTALEVIAYGRIGEFKYDSLKLSLKVFNVY